MKHKLLPKHIVFFLMIMLVFTACSNKENLSQGSLSFSGDIESWLSIKEIATNIEPTSITYHETTIEAYELHDLILKAEPVVKAFDVYIRANDGFLVRLDGDTIEDTYLAFIEEQGWLYISDKHPVNSGVKHISDIIVVTNDKGYKSDDKLLSGIDPDFYGLNIIHELNDHYYTKGELLLLNNRQFILEDGESSFEGVSIDVLKQVQTVTLTSLVETTFEKVLVYTFAGEEYYDYNTSGSIEVTSDQINYISEDLSEVKLNIVGLMTDPIGTSVMNNYYDVSHYVDKDTRVLSILLDGFSYDQFEFVKEMYPDLILSKLDNVKIAKTVYKPVTNAGLAAIVSGVSPIESGVLNRSFRELNVETIFDYCEDKGKSHILIEGDINILSLNTTTKLNLDTDGNGVTDNEIMKASIEVLDEEYDYTFIHFHSIDEFGHNFGPLSEETIGQIRLIDTYLEEIISGFDGKIIITADHGMHKIEDYGDHGDFRYEDLFVPYIVVEGGNNE